jgi:DNA replication and repair protein RecF
VRGSTAAGRARDVLGILRTVLFAPEDLALVKGDPEGRRRFLDQLVVQLLPRAAGLLQDYERVVRQRSALLKSLRQVRGAGRTPDTSTLEVWDAKAAQLGGQILAMRHALVAALRPEVAAAYAQVSDANGRAELEYRSTVPHDGGDALPSAPDLEKAMLAALAEAHPQEVERGVSLVGPHRDDLVLELAGLPAKGYASHGESWSFALALRLASYRLLGGSTVDSTVGVPDDGTSPAPGGARGVEPVFWDPDHGTDADPVLILDDVFAELDVRRRQRLAELVAPARQVLVTAAVPEDVPPGLLGARYEVTPGAVRRAG